MKVKVILKVDEIIIKSLRPDNIDLPKNMVIKETDEELIIEYKNENLLTFLNTLDEMLEEIEMLEKVFKK